MKDALKLAASILVVIVFFYVVGFFATGGDLAIYSYWAPKRADAERNVFEHSQSYTEGKIQNLNQLCYAELKAEGVQKLAIQGEIRNEAATINEARLPADEQACVDRAKGL